MSSWGSNATACAGRPGAVSADLHDRVGLARDDVRVGDDEAGAGDPAAALDPSPHAVPSTRTTLARRPRARPAWRAIPRVGAGTSAAGPRTDGSGSNRASALRIGPDGGSNWLSSREDRRALDVASQRLRAGGLQRDRADDPGDPEPDAGGQRGAEQAVDRAAARAAASADARAHPDALRSRWRARRPPAARRSGRTAARTANATRSAAAAARGACRGTRPSANPTSDKHPDDEALQIAVEGEQRGEADDHPVDRCHLREVTTLLATRAPHLLPFHVRWLKAV